jgi:transcription antitermination factor NusG
MSLQVRQRVKITTGPLMDQEGEILSIQRKAVKVAIDSLGYVLVAYIDRTKLTSARPE